MPAKALRRLLGPTREELHARLERAEALFQSMGEDVQINPSAAIDYPQGIALGRRVSIGKHVRLDAEGGLQIQDGVEIGDGVRIRTTCPADANSAPYVEREWRQVVIERGVKVGKNAVVGPGVTIGQGATIPPGAVVTHDIAATEHERIDRPDPKICFVLTTGRSGSTTLAETLDRHPGIRARHEPRFQLIKWSTDLAHGETSQERIEADLYRLLKTTSVYDKNFVHVRSDQKYFNLVPILNKIFPGAKFIWLVRSAKEVVASAVGRSWYADPSHPNWRNIDWYYHAYRVQGDRSGAMTTEQWAGMSPFERNCWYWSHVNTVIEQALENVPSDRQMFLRLEDLQERLGALIQFLEVEQSPIAPTQSNRASYATYPEAQWTKQERDAFNRICGPLMRRLYPELPPA